MEAPGGTSKLLDMLFSWTRPALAMLPGASPVATQQATVERCCLTQFPVGYSRVVAVP